jgi:hypothetical protein
MPRPVADRTRNSPSHVALPLIFLLQFLLPFESSSSSSEPGGRSRHRPRLRAGQPRGRGSIPGRGKGFFLQSVLLGTEAHTPSSSTGTVGSFSEGIAPGYLSTLLSARTENKWIHTSAVHTISRNAQ